MAKRRLSKQQQDRIAKNQGAELAVNGVVISHYGKQLDVESLGDGATVRCHQRANLPTLVTGDRVEWQPGDDGVGVIVGLEPRRSVFARPGFAGVVKPMAANIDVVLVVIAPVPQPMANLIDRYLVAIETLGLQPILVLNKQDLLRVEDTVTSDLLALYKHLGYRVFEVSAIEQQGLETLRSALGGHTAALVGQSGVGKSSLVNGLGVDAELAAVGGLSEFHAKGTHTTTTSRLFHLEGFDLIDSPGIREFGLGHVSAQDVLNGFVELRDLVEHCKFRDCSHQGDPGCAIAAAMDAGDIDEGRLNSYFQILESL